MGASLKVFLKCTKTAEFKQHLFKAWIQMESRPFKSTAGSQSHMTEGVKTLRSACHMAL